MTMANIRTNLANEVISEVKEYLKREEYNTVIPRNIR
jgi:cellulose biosynthesis protein BcsQ